MIVQEYKAYSGTKWVLLDYYQRFGDLHVQNLDIIDDPNILHYMYKIGVLNTDEIVDFVIPYDTEADFEHVHDVNRAIELIHSNIRDQRLIIIIGDYDNDGISSAFLFSLFLESLDYIRFINYDVKINERQYGYGLNAHIMDYIKQYQDALVVTLDHGTTFTSKIKELLSQKYDVLIIDHHPTDRSEEIIGLEQLYSNFAIVNPMLDLPSNRYVKNKYQTTTTLTYRLIKSYFKHYHIPLPKIIEKYADLPGMSVISDYMKWNYDNLSLVKNTYNLFKSNHANPLYTNIVNRTINSISSINNDNFHEKSAFYIVPLLNAAGRINRAVLALDAMFNSIESSLALDKSVELLWEANQERKRINAENKKLIDDYIRTHYSNGSLPLFLILAIPNLDSGVLSSLAASISSEYNRPLFLLTLESNNQWRGSARSSKYIPNLRFILDKVAESGMQFHGHEAAFGVSIYGGDQDYMRYLENKFAQAIESYKGLIGKNIEEISGIISTPKDIVKMKEYVEIFEITHCNNKPAYLLDNFTMDNRYISIGSERIPYQYDKRAYYLPSSHAVQNLIVRPVIDQDKHLMFQILDVIVR